MIMSEAPVNSSVPQAMPEDAAKPGNGGRKRRIRILLAVLIVGVLAGVGYWLYVRNYESTDDAFIDGHVIFVSPKVAGQVVQLSVQDNQEVSVGQLLVEIDPRDYEVRLAQAKAMLEAAQARKRSADINVDLTGVTSKADVDAAAAGVEIAQAALAAAGTQLAGSKSRLEQAKAAVGTAQATVEQNKADVVANEAEATRTSDDLKRYRQLMQSGSATQQQMDFAAAAAQSAQAKLESARKKVAVGEAQVAEAQAAGVTAAEGVKQAEAQRTQAASGVTEAQARMPQVNVAAQRVDLSVSQRDSAAADIQQLEAAVRQAELQHSYTKVTAPQAGRVTKRTVEQGAFVQVGQPLMAIVPDQIWVVANFKETQLTYMQPGQPVTVRVDAYPGHAFKAHVDSIQEGTGARFSLLPPENATGNYVKIVQRVPVKIVFDEQPDPKYPLAPGMSVVPTVKVR
jgi:membrane fusion protein, multidrug efflux system